jgi:hypothetical protein
VNLPTRPLAGCAVGLSISESDDSTARGFPPGQINHVTIQLARDLFGQGVAVVFGHDWRDDGVMDAVVGLALEMQAGGDGEAGRPPLLQNYLPWPDRPVLDDRLRDQLGSALRVESAGLPQELNRYRGMKPEVVRQLPEYGYVRARGLTHLRRRLEERTHARICIGGRLRRSQGRYPGVVEEALLALDGNKPLYLCGVLGGAARQLIHAVRGGPIPTLFFEPAAVAANYAVPPQAAAESSPATADDRSILPAEAVWKRFADAGVEGLSGRNGLTVEENRQLFETPAIESALRLVLIGLSRVYRGSV